MKLIWSAFSSMKLNFKKKKNSFYMRSPRVYSYNWILYEGDKILVFVPMPILVFNWYYYTGNKNLLWQVNGAGDHVLRSLLGSLVLYYPIDQYKYVWFNLSIYWFTIIMLFLNISCDSCSSSHMVKNFWGDQVSFASFGCPNIGGVDQYKRFCKW